MALPSLPDMHYLSEPQRAHVYPAVARTTTVPSLPDDFAFNAPKVVWRARGPRYIIGWLEFRTTEEPDPEVARPGDVWIQLPVGNRKARVYVCYASDGKEWTPWPGNAVSIADRAAARRHPLVSADHVQRKFFLAYNGRDFTWVNGKGLSDIQHGMASVAKMGPADSVAKWIALTAHRERAEESDNDATHATSAPLPSRKRGRFVADVGTASAPPTKRAKSVEEPHGSAPSPTVRLGAYARVGAQQKGWHIYIDGKELRMPTPCSVCAKDGTLCSGLPGERCGRCRYKKRACTHNESPRKPRGPYARKSLGGLDGKGDMGVITVRRTTLRGMARKPRTLSTLAKSKSSAEPVKRRRGKKPGPAKHAAKPAPAPPPSDRLSPMTEPESSDLEDNDDDDDDDKDDDEEDLDAPEDKDDAAVENLLSSVAPASGALDEGEPSPVTAAEDVDRTLHTDEAGEEDEEEQELARFVQMTLEGMARVQEGLRGVFMAQRKKSGANRRGSPSKQVAAT
ncbi:hypothetical protein BC834DRAFT_974250 [Gloeopeniophorella convolvens]|nr:hypothetical protein BC834DRAFT_974250 [Gloeopeniophorella convolvens]